VRPVAPAARIAPGQPENATRLAAPPYPRRPVISRRLTESMKGSSWIRRMFEEGARLKAQHGERDVFDFSLGNPVIEPPAQVARALADAAADASPGIHRYMPNAGFPEVRDAVARSLAADTGRPFEGRHVVMCVGAGGGLNVVMKTLLDPGDEVVLLAPYFVEYLFYVENHGGVPRVAETDAQFQLDLAAIEAAIGPRTRAVILNSPNNPTGVVYPRESLDALGKLLSAASKRNGRAIALVTDEPYRRIAFEQSPPWVFDSYADTILVTSHSKDLALPGERIGYIAVSPAFDGADEFVGGATFATRTLGFVNAPAIQQRAIARLQGVSVDPALYRRKRDRLWGALTAMGYDVVKPGGAFYLFPRTLNPDDVAFVRELQAELVLTVPGVGFGRPGHLRVSYCVEDETIERALPAFERVAKRYRG
jgi:aspartate aminotransferase